MMPWLTKWWGHPATVIILGVVVIFLGRALHFHLRCRFLAKVERRWRAFLKMEKPSYDDANVRWLEERTLKMKRLVEAAHADPADVPLVRPAGGGFVEQASFSPLENWLKKTSDIIPTVSTSLIRAQGHYRDERNNNLNPLGWIEQLVFLPRNLITSIDPRIPKWVKDLMQILYWLIASGAAILGLLTRASQ